MSAEATAAAPELENPAERLLGAGDTAIRTVVAAEVEATSIDAVRKKLGVSHAALACYLAGRARRGTTLLVETMAKHLFVKRKG